MKLHVNRGRGRALPCLALLALCLAPPLQAADWPPVSPEELALKEFPGNPGAHAMILYREIERDDIRAYANYYYRIKIFTEEGREHANIQIPHIRDFYRVTGIEARTIQPDGRIIQFSGEVFEKPLFKSKRRRWMAKVFTLPEVQPGCIIEYKFNLRWSDKWLYSSWWDVQHELFTRRAHFSIRPYRGDSRNDGMVSLFESFRRSYTFAYTGRLAGSQQPVMTDKGIVQLDIENVPAFGDEPLMPPEETLKMQVSFFYSRHQASTLEEFWEQEAEAWRKAVDKFVGGSKSLRQEASALVGPADSPEEKLRKLYTRAQQVHNLSFERTLTEKEEKRADRKEHKDAKSVLKEGYGTRAEINRLFVALARGAGLDAQVVRIAERDETFFQPNVLDWTQLNAEVAMVRLGGEQHYFDPGTPYCPFGLLSWEKTAVKGFGQEKTAGIFLTTPEPQAEDSTTKRAARLSLDEAGTLTGTLEVSYLGQEAVDRRLSALKTDAAGQRKEMEDEIRGWLPGGAKVDIQTLTGLEATEEPVRVEAKVEIPDVAVSTGRRLLLPLGLFQTTRPHPFTHAQRRYPVYLEYPFQEFDDVTVELPEGFRVESRPATQQFKQIFARYELSSENEGSTLHIKRHRALDKYYIPTQAYGALRSFYNFVRSSDGETVVLEKVSDESGS